MFFIKKDFLRIFALLLLWLSFAIVFVFGKISLSHFEVVDFLLLRMVIAGASFLFFASLMAYRKGQINLAFNGQDWLLLALVSLLHMFIPFLFEYHATQFLHPAKISLLYSLTPFVTVLIGFLLRTEKLSFAKGGAVACGSLATFLATVPSDFSLISIRSSLISFGGFAELLLLAAIAIDSFAWFLVAELLKRRYSMAFINGITMLTAGFGFIALKTIVLGLPVFSFLSVQASGWKLLGAVILFSNFIGYSLFTYLLTIYPLTLISLSGFLCPLFTAVLSYLFLGCHSVSPIFILSFMLGFVGLLIYQQDMEQ